MAAWDAAVRAGARRPIDHGDKCLRAPQQILGTASCFLGTHRVSVGDLSHLGR